MPAFFFKGMGIRRWSAMLRFDKLGPTRRLILGAFATTLIVSITAKLLISSHQAEAQPASTFNGDAAVMLHFVKPGSTATYEGLMGRLGEALHKNQNEETKRQAQAAGWKVYRAGTDISGQGSVMYAWVIDPVIDGADYAASTILSEAFPAEVPQFH